MNRGPLGPLLLFKEAILKKKQVKKPGGGSPLYIFGLDDKGKPRGARFPQGLQDNIVAVATDMKFSVVHAHSVEFAALGQKLPVGRIYGSGKSFIPNIRRDLFEKLKVAQGQPNEPVKDGAYVNVVGSSVGSPTSNPDSAASPSIPKTWSEISAGDLIIAQSSHIEGWWEAIVIERTPDDVLTLRWRDYPAEGTVQRHIGGVALINPGSE
jgi:hypothetical protein